MLPTKYLQRPPPLLQRIFRKRLSAHRRVDISIVHHVNLDVIAKGGADISVLWDLAGSVLTWKTVAERINLGQAEMQAQLELVERLISRFGAKSVVAFEGDDYQIAKEGVVVMDLLADEVDIATAAWAAERGNLELNHRFVRRYACEQG